MRKFYPLITAAKLRKFHDLRYTFASMHLKNGASVTWVKEQTGHHSIQVIVDHYGHLIPRENRAAASGLGAAITAPLEIKSETEPSDTEYTSLYTETKTESCASAQAA